MLCSEGSVKPFICFFFIATIIDDREISKHEPVLHFIRRGYAIQYIY